MNELLVKWLDALESGEYEQGRGALRTSTGFCCLGVLCDVMDNEGWTEIGPEVTEDWKNPETSPAYMYQNYSAMAPDEVVDLLELPERMLFSEGLSPYDPDEYDHTGPHPTPLSVIHEGSMVPVAELNDTGASFKTIAEAIRYTYNHFKNEEQEVKYGE